MDCIKEVEGIKKYMIDMRRYFHQYPEASNEEFQTAKSIQKELDDMEIPWKIIANTGIIATIGKGEKVIALRADMDALKIYEKTDVPYKSKQEGLMHACGHDGHMAILLGVAKVLKKYEDTLNCVVKLIFQPAEENVSGAKVVIREGGLEGVEEIFGLHLFTDIPCGQVSLEEGPRMASTNQVTITIHGISGHAGKPHQSVDATLVAAHILINIQSIVSRFTDPIDSVAVSFGMLHSGTLRNVISNKAVLEGTVRTFNKEKAVEVGKQIEQIATSIANAYGASVDVAYEMCAHPAVINDKEVVEKALIGAKKVLPEETFVCIPKMMLGEDFSWYMEQVKGAFAFVGAGNDKIQCSYPNHHDKFNLDERCLEIGALLHLSYVLENSNK